MGVDTVRQLGGALIDGRLVPLTADGFLELGPHCSPLFQATKQHKRFIVFCLHECSEKRFSVGGSNFTAAGAAAMRVMATQFPYSILAAPSFQSSQGQTLWCRKVVGQEIQF